MKKFLFYPFCLMMGSCFINDNSKSSSKTQPTSKICDASDTFFESIKDDKAKQMFSKISSVLLATKKIYDGEEIDDIDTSKGEYPGWQKNVLEIFKGENDVANLLHDDEETRNKDAADLFLDFYQKLCDQFQKKNVFVTQKNGKIERSGDNYIAIDENLIKSFIAQKAAEKKTEKDRDKQSQIVSTKVDDTPIYLSDLVNYYLKKKGLVLLKKSKYLVVKLQKKGNVVLENRDKVEVFRRSLQGEMIMKLVCSVFSDGQYLESESVFEKNIPSFFKNVNKKIDNNTAVVCLYTLQKVNEAKLESLIENE